MSFTKYLKRTDQLFRRWAEEPIGVGVPVVAFFAVWLPPQMPDMFAGMDAPLGSVQFSVRPVLFALAAVLLGLSSWFWTRAALTAQHDRAETDKARLTRKRGDRQTRSTSTEGGTTKHARRGHGEDYLNWSHEWAPRIALLAAGGITLLPIMFSMASGQIMWGLLGAELLSFGLVGLLFVFVIYRTEFRWMRAFGAPAWMLKTRATRILGCAPFGWPFAVLSLACSLAALIFVAVWPNLVARLDAPTSAIAALAFAVGPLVIALAIFRGLVERSFYLLRWLANRSELVQLAPGESYRVKRLSNPLGALAMLAWFLSPPWVLEKHLVRFSELRILEPAGAGSCQTLTSLPTGETYYCRPNLKEALTDWVAARRPSTTDAQARLPIIIVAAEGGASRAAVWLLSAMRMLDAQTQGEFGQHVFALSGVSGGSLGAVTYLRMLRAKGRTDGSLDWQDPEVQQSLASLATRDLLSATIATYFLNDMFGSLVGPVWTHSGVPDRNTALEMTFDQAWKESGFSLPTDVPDTLIGVRYAASETARTSVRLLPHLFLNGTDVTSGERIITSTVRLAGDPMIFPDSGDFLRLAIHDVRLATAVTNSARFPFVSPAGRFTSDSEARDYQVIDGGYFENYGARTAWELARAIEDLNEADPQLRVSPIVVVVSNDLDADQPPRSANGRCRTQLGDIAADGSQVTIRCDEPVKDESCIEVARGDASGIYSSHDQSIVPQSIAPILGLAATRTAHGRDALNILKRDFCRAQTAVPGDARVRMIHIALPLPDRSKGEAAPMNWVLGADACDYMLNKAPWFEFNLAQARRLRATLSAITGRTIDGDAEFPTRIACR